LAAQSRKSPNRRRRRLGLSLVAPLSLERNILDEKYRGLKGTLFFVKMENFLKVVSLPENARGCGWRNDHYIMQSRILESIQSSPFAKANRPRKLDFSNQNTKLS
jgi:hypothetical protein